VATARLDAVWDHDGVLEVRDYKTGRVAEHSIGEDRRAWLQAWVAAPFAAAHGLRLRVRYEYLSAEVPDDPEPWEPGDDDLEMVEQELVGVVTAMRAERDWVGVADAAICGWCDHRSICPDSAARTEPSWPAVRADAGTV
jgi:putative RecB family exonuclease